MAVIAMELPAFPMSPISSPDIPLGPEWGYQIKWDGVRTITRLDGNGGVELFSKRMELRNTNFPDIVAMLAGLRIGPCVLDGEIVYFDGIRPNFQRGMLARSKRGGDDNLILVLFDMLFDQGEDLRSLPFRERFKRLNAKFPDKHPRLFVTELFEDGNALWEWINQHDWEGIVSKRLNSKYTEGQNHQDWYKKRKELRIVADVVGVKLREGRVASLVLSYEDRYIGHVSSGLDTATKAILQQFIRDHPGGNPFSKLTPGMTKSQVAWLAVPFPCRVTALEFTDSGLLRHPRLIGFGTGE